MTLAEFKAWFEGFTEDMDGSPSKKQWERIKARVAEINGVTVTERVFVDRYAEPYKRYWPAGPYWLSGPFAAYSTAGTINHGNGLMSQSTPGKADLFNSSKAMLDLGKAEYKSALS